MLCPKPFDATYSLEEYYCAGDVHFDGVNTCGLKKMWFSQDEKSKYCVQTKDLLIVEGGAGAGGCSVVSDCEKERYIQNSILIARHPSNSTVYLKYLIETLVRKGYIDIVCNEATFAHFTKDKVCHVPYPVIPKEEQETIASWLDEKCGEIDAAIAKVDREIELIDELKQSEISRAVTHGLNPNAPLRPSGIDWIGEIPEHWEICKVKHKYQLLTGITPATKIHEYYDNNNGETWVTIGDLKGDIVTDSSNKVSHKYLKEFSPKITPKGSLLYSFKLSVGQVCFAGDNLYTNEAIASFLYTSEVNLNFLKYSSSMIINNANINIYGAPIMNQELIKNAPIVFPPLPEQREIASYLDQKCAEIDDLKSKLKRKRDTLVELRQSMISEVVTGKRKVV